MAARTRFLQLAIAFVNIVIAALVFTSIWPFPSGDVKIDLPSANEVRWGYEDGVVSVTAPFSISNGGFWDIDDLTISYQVTNYSQETIVDVLLDESKITGYNQQYQGFYNRVAGGYDGAIRLGAILTGGGEERYRMEFLRELEIQDGDRVLEVSVGTGANLHYLPGDADYYGLDLSWGMLKRCQKNLKRWQREAELIMGNAEELPFQDGVFYSVFHVGGINAFNDREKAICEMIRVARAGTKIVIVDETAKLMQAVAWMPTARKWLQEHGERFSAPVGLVPEGMRDVQARDFAKGNMYCLTFRKP